MALGDVVQLSSNRQLLDIMQRDSGYVANHAWRAAVVSITSFHFQRFCLLFAYRFVARVGLDDAHGLD